MGSLSDSELLSGQSVDDLYNFYRTMYKKVSDEDIEEVSYSFGCCIGTMLPLSHVWRIYIPRISWCTRCTDGVAKTPRSSSLLIEVQRTRHETCCASTQSFAVTCSRCARRRYDMEWVIEVLCRT